MSSPTNAERSNRLARVRENQRRSRARRQQYIDELEHKVAAFDAQAQQKDIEHRLALQKVETENANLRALLNGIGVDNGYLETYLRRCSVPETSEKIAIPALTKSTSRSSSGQHSPAGPDTPPQFPQDALSAKESGLCCSAVTTCVPVAGSALTDTNLVTEQNKELLPMVPVMTEAPNMSETSMTTSAPADKGLRLPPISAICDCGPGSYALWPNDENSLNSTLCGIAEDLINRYNIHGVDINLIKQRLWPGFRKSGPDGCRVENGVLLEVLDELSANFPS